MFVSVSTAVNWVLIQEGTDLTLVDAGWRGDESTWSGAITVAPFAPMPE